MKTALFVSIFLHGKGPYCETSRVDRVLKYLTYYSEFQKDLGVDQIYVSDNGGNGSQIFPLLNHFPDIELIRHPHLMRGEPGPVFDYLPCWRAFYDYKKVIADGFEKIIIMDDDAYILSDCLMNYVRDLESGWTTLWCPTFNFPESALSILCKDAFPRYEEFTREPYWNKNKSIIPFENLIPYTTINHNFNCDRWGETRAPQTAEMDAYFQCPADLHLIPKLDLASGKCWSPYAKFLPTED